VVPPQEVRDVEGVDPVAARFLRAAHVQRIVDNAARNPEFAAACNVASNPLGPDTQLRSGHNRLCNDAVSLSGVKHGGDWRRVSVAKVSANPCATQPLVIVGSHLLENRIGGW